MKLEEILSKHSIEDIQKVPKNICEMFVVDSDVYKLLDKTEKDSVDFEMINFKKSRDYLGFYKKDGYRIFVKSSWLSKSVCERRIAKFLNGDK